MKKVLLPIEVPKGIYCMEHNQEVGRFKVCYWKDMGDCKAFGCIDLNSDDFGVLKHKECLELKEIQYNEDH